MGLTSLATPPAEKPASVHRVHETAPMIAVLPLALKKTTKTKTN